MPINSTDLVGLSGLALVYSPLHVCFSTPHQAIKVCVSSSSFAFWAGFRGTYCYREQCFSIPCFENFILASLNLMSFYVFKLWKSSNFSKCDPVKRVAKQPILAVSGADKKAP